MRKPTGKSIVDIGRLAGVSFTTAARALRNDPHVSAETQHNVYKAAYQLGYVQKQKKSHPVIGIQIPPGEHSFYVSSSFQTILKEIVNRGWHFEVIPSDFSELRTEQYLSGMVNIYQGDDVKWNTNFLQPLITFRRYKPFLDNVYSIAEDGAHDVEECVNYLWTLGHRKIGLLLNHSQEEEQESMEQRYHAFLQSMTQRGAVKPEKNVFFNRDGSLSSRINRLFENRVSAIIVIADDLVLQVYGELLKRGLQIPRDISLLGWEIPHICENLYPAITALQQNYTDWAKAVCDLFESIWAGENAEHTIYIPGKLLIRESCAAVNPSI